VAVEHEESTVVLYEMAGRQVRLLDRLAVAYHPDGAKWIDDRHVVAAVEKSRSLDIFEITEDGKLRLKAQINVGFEPRDVFVTPSPEGGWLMVATPYSGKQVVWVHWRIDGTHKMASQTWCQTPWHISLASKGPKDQGPGLVTGCMDDNQLLYVPLPATLDQAISTPPQVMRRFGNVPRRVGLAPSGRYWYVALEIGGHVARYDVAMDAWQMLPFTPFGAVGVAPMNDHTVAWGENNRIIIATYDSEGKVLAQRDIAVSGLPTELQWSDVDRDGHLDLLSMNSTGPASDLLYGPLAP